MYSKILRKFHLLFLSVFLIMTVTSGNIYSQNKPIILIDGNPSVVSNMSGMNYWLHEGQTLATGNLVNSISVMQFNIAVSPSGGNTLQFESVVSVTSLQTVPTGKSWKLESVSIDPAADFMMQGITGATGATGSTGLTGATGATGPTGSGITPCSGAPATPGPIIGSGMVYQNMTYSYMVGSVPTATTYTWNYTGSGVTISGTTNPVNINFSTSATSGNLTVTASCGNGNSISAAFPIVVRAVPTGTATFNFLGEMQVWQVPEGVTSVTLDVRGAGTSGKGGRAVGTLAVNPFQNLYIFVGGSSTHFTSGGEYGNTNGGDASSVRLGGTGLEHRIIVGGGSGGSGGGSTGGNGGSSIGATGTASGGGNGGTGGTQSAGGSGGTGGGGNGSAGTLGTGGAPGNTNYAGGGGGGYYGGGGGGFGGSGLGGGGGGGSNYLSPILTNTTNTQGYQSGNGQIIITY